MKWGIIFAGFLAVTLFGVSSFLEADGGSSNVAADTTIIGAGTCSVTNSGAVTFDISGVGLVHNAADSDEETITFTNAGTDTASVDVRSDGDFEDTGNIARMDREQLAHGAAVSTFASKTPLTDTDVEIIAALVGTPIATTWQIQPVMQAGDEFFTGAIDLTIASNFACA